MLASLAGVTDRDPLGTTSYVNPISGATKTVATIAGHRDWAATECPGNTFYPTLPSCAPTSLPPSDGHAELKLRGVPAGRRRRSRIR